MHHHCVHDSLLHFLVFFFFSSRRRHTRCSRDWSSDVCSSDLEDRSRLRADERFPPLADQVRAGPQLAQRACSDERRPRGGGVRIEQVEGVGHSRCTSSFKRSARPVGITSVWPLARTTTISSRPTTATCSLSDQITDRRTSSATVAFPTTTLPCASGLRMRNKIGRAHV